MTANHDLERRIADYYASEAPPTAPDWVLESTLATIDTTPQRRALRVPWRFPNMNIYAKVAVAAVAVIAVGVIGMAVLRPGSAPGVGGPPVTPSPTPAPSRSATLPPLPTPSPYVPPTLTETFTSNIHGISIRFPAGWRVQPATEPWSGSSWPLFREPAGDFIYDPARTDHLFFGLASKALGDASLEEWAADWRDAAGCAPSEPVVVDGADAILLRDCGVAMVSAEGRLYVILLYRSGDDSELRSLDSGAWLEEILATVQLRPEDAVDASPSASP